MTNISSLAKQIIFCDEDFLSYDYFYDDYGEIPTAYNIRVHPEENFTVAVAALGQTGSPVPTTVYSEKMYTGYESGTNFLCILPYTRYKMMLNFKTHIKHTICHLCSTDLLSCGLGNVTTLKVHLCR